MTEPKEVLGVNKLCQACGLSGSPLHEDWVFFNRCNHVVHKECAHNYNNRCGECGRKSEMLTFDKKRRTQFDHAAKTMKTLGRNDQFQAHLFKLMDDSSKHLKSRLGALKSMAQDRKEEAKIRMKSKLLLRKAKKTLHIEKLANDAPTSPPEVRYVENARVKPHEYEEIGDRREENSDGREESDDGRETSIQPDEEAIQDARIPNTSSSPCEEEVIEALCTSIITLTELIEEIQKVIKASHFHNDLTTEIGSQICSSIKRAIGTKNFEELVSLLPDYEENLLEAIRLSEEAETKTDVAREAARQAGRLASTWEILKLEDKEKRDGSMITVGPSPNAKLLLETAAAFGCNLSCLRSRIRDMVVGEVNQKWEEGKIDSRDNAGLILEACDFSRGLYPGRNVNIMNWETVNTPKNLPHILGEMEQAKDRDLKQQAMLQVSFAMLEIKERQLEDAKETVDKLAKMQQENNIKNEEIMFGQEILISTQIDQWEVEKDRTTRIVNAIEMLPEKLEALKSKMRMETPEAVVDKIEMMRAERDFVIMEMKAIASTAMSCLPPEEKEERMEKLRKGVQIGLGVEWAKGHGEYEEMTKWLKNYCKRHIKEDQTDKQDADAAVEADATIEANAQGGVEAEDKDESAEAKEQKCQRRKRGNKQNQNKKDEGQKTLKDAQTNTDTHRWSQRRNMSGQRMGRNPNMSPNRAQKTDYGPRSKIPYPIDRPTPNPVYDKPRPVIGAGIMNTMHSDRPMRHGHQPSANQPPQITINLPQNQPFNQNLNQIRPTPYVIDHRNRPTANLFAQIRPTYQNNAANGSTRGFGRSRYGLPDRTESDWRRRGNEEPPTPSRTSSPRRNVDHSAVRRSVSFNPNDTNQKKPEGNKKKENIRSINAIDVENETKSTQNENKIQIEKSPSEQDKTWNEFIPGYEPNETRQQVAINRANERITIYLANQNSPKEEKDIVMNYDGKFFKDIFFQSKDQTEKSETTMSMKEMRAFVNLVKEADDELNNHKDWKKGKYPSLSAEIGRMRWKRKADALSEMMSFVKRLGKMDKETQKKITDGLAKEREEKRIKNQPWEDINMADFDNEVNDDDSDGTDSTDEVPELEDNLSEDEGLQTDTDLLSDVEWKMGDITINAINADRDDEEDRPPRISRPRPRPMTPDYWAEENENNEEIEENDERYEENGNNEETNEKYEENDENEENDGNGKNEQANDEENGPTEENETGDNLNESRNRQLKPLMPCEKHQEDAQKIRSRINDECEILQGKWVKEKWNLVEITSAYDTVNIQVERNPSENDSCESCDGNWFRSPYEIAHLEKRIKARNLPGSIVKVHKMDDDGNVVIKAAWNPCVEVKQPSAPTGDEKTMDYFHVVPCESVQPNLCGGRVFIHRNEREEKTEESSTVLKRKRDEHDENDQGPSVCGINLDPTKDSDEEDLSLVEQVSLPEMSESENEDENHIENEDENLSENEDENHIENEDENLSEKVDGILSGNEDGKLTKNEDSELSENDEKLNENETKELKVNEEKDISKDKRTKVNEEDDEMNKKREKETENDSDMEDRKMLEQIKNMALGETMKIGAEKVHAPAHGLEAVGNSPTAAVVRPKVRIIAPSVEENYKKAPFVNEDYEEAPSIREDYERAPSTDSESEIKMAKSLAQLQGENVKLRKERDSYKRRAQSMVWENNLFLTENKWRKAKDKLENPPSEEKRADIIGVTKEILDQNKILKMGNADLAERKALLGGTVREMGETYLSAVARLGPIGLKEKRRTVRQEMERELEQEKKLKTFDEIKRQVIQEAKNEHFMFQMRMNRIHQKVEDKYVPKSWVWGDYKVDWQHLEDMNIRRIKSMRDGDYEIGITHLDDYMG